MTIEEIRVQLALGSIQFKDACDIVATTKDINIVHDILKTYDFNTPSIGEAFSYRSPLRSTASTQELISLAKLNRIIYNSLVRGILGKPKIRFTEAEAITLINILDEHTGKSLHLADCLDAIQMRSQAHANVYLEVLKRTNKQHKARRKVIAKLYNMGHFVFTETPSKKNIL